MNKAGFICIVPAERGRDAAANREGSARQTTPGPARANHRGKTNARLVFSGLKVVARWNPLVVAPRPARGAGLTVRENQ
jgi:hypothetical protein